MKTNNYDTAFLQLFKIKHQEKTLGLIQEENLGEMSNNYERRKTRTIETKANESCLYRESRLIIKTPNLPSGYTM